MIVPKCRIAGTCNDDWDFVRFEDGNDFSNSGHGLGVQYRDDNNDSPMYLVAPYDHPSQEQTGEQTKLRVVALFEEKGDWVIEHTSVDLDSSHFNTDGDALQPGSNVYEVSLTESGCLHAVDVDGESLFTALHCRPTSTSGHIVRWYEIELNGWPFSKDEPELVQQGEVNKLSQGIECYYPSLAVNNARDMALTWTQSGSSQHVQMWRGLRCASDTPETLPDTEMIVDCETSLDPLRPDYSGTTLDPDDAQVFFGHTTIVDDGSSPTGWETWVGKYVLSCTTFGSNCYADCDTANGRGTLDVFDFLCFQNAFDAGCR